MLVYADPTEVEIGGVMYRICGICGHTEVWEDQEWKLVPNIEDAPEAVRETVEEAMDWAATDQQIGDGGDITFVCEHIMSDWEVE